LYGEVSVNFFFEYIKNKQTNNGSQKIEVEKKIKGEKDK